jgi:hypothetical protein
MILLWFVALWFLLCQLEHIIKNGLGSLVGIGWTFLFWFDHAARWTPGAAKLSHEI